MNVPPENNLSKVTSHEKDFSEAVKLHYGATTTYNIDGTVYISYPDLRELIITPTDDPNIVLMTGAKINNEEIKVSYNPDSTLPFADRVTFDANKTYINPCGQHPTGETFQNCFIREVHDFCDGAVGCLSIMVFPGYVGAVIAAHCAIC